MAKKWLLLLLEVNEELLPAGNAYTALPDQLEAAVSQVASGAIDLAAVYILNTLQKRNVERVANDTAINYHHYAVSVRGEKCTEEDCEEHTTKNVIHFNDHKNGYRTPPGVN